MLPDDGSGKGAALVAAVTTSNRFTSEEAIDSVDTLKMSTVHEGDADNTGTIVSKTQADLELTA